MWQRFAEAPIVFIMFVLLLAGLWVYERHYADRPEKLLDQYGREVAPRCDHRGENCDTFRPIGPTKW